MKSRQQVDGSREPRGSVGTIRAKGGKARSHAGRTLNNSQAGGATRAESNPLLSRNFDDTASAYQ